MLIQGPQVGKMVLISMIGLEISSVSNERAACLNAVLHCCNLCHVVFVHLCTIKGFVDAPQDHRLLLFAYCNL